MTTAQLRIADTIDQFYDETSPYAQEGARYKEVSKYLDEEARNQMDQNYRQTVLEPLAKFHDFFPQINSVIKRRQKKLLDFDSIRSKARKLVERPSEDSDKLPRTEKQVAEAKKIYEEINQQLIIELPKLVDIRVPYMDPSFEALLKSQLEFSRDAFKKLDTLRNEFGGLGQVQEGRVESVLQQMRDLAIVGQLPN